MEAAPGQRASTPTFLPPAASASPWVGFSLFATDSLAFLAWLFLPLSALQIRVGRVHCLPCLCVYWSMDVGGWD